MEHPDLPEKGQWRLCLGGAGAEGMGVGMGRDLCGMGERSKERGGMPLGRGRLRVRVVVPEIRPARKGGDPSAREGQMGHARAACGCGPSAGCEQLAWAKQAR